MTPILIGYFPKRTKRKPDWLEAAGVTEICSVSRCISEAPDEWIEKWLHNDLFIYDSPELAWSAVPEAVRPEYDLFAYKLFPVVFENRERKPFALPEIHVQSLPDSFTKLGYDAVSRFAGAAFECSPLSCNSMANKIPVNQYCLFDDPEIALQKAADFEGSGCEPGPYFVIEVWR